MWKQLKMELHKVWRRPIFIFFLSVPVILFIYEICFGDRLNQRAEAHMSVFNIDYSAAFYSYLMSKIAMFSLILYVLITYYYYLLEHKNQCLNLLFTLPSDILIIYLAKVLVLIGYVIGYGLVVYGMSAFSTLLYDRLILPPVMPLVLFTGGSILIVIFQFVIAHLTRTLIFDLILFILLFALTMFDKSGTLRILLPYGYIGLYSADFVEVFPNIIYIFPVYILLVSILGFFVFKDSAYRNRLVIYDFLYRYYKSRIARQ